MKGWQGLQRLRRTGQVYRGSWRAGQVYRGTWMAGQEAQSFIEGYPMGIA